MEGRGREGGEERGNEREREQCYVRMVCDFVYTHAQFQHTSNNIYFEHVISMHKIDMLCVSTST